MSLPARDRKEIERYLQKMRCPRCNGKGCERCGKTGDSSLFKSLLHAATRGITRMKTQ